MSLLIPSPPSDIPAPSEQVREKRDTHGQSKPLIPRYERYRLQTFGVTWLEYFGFYLTRKSFSVSKTMLGDAGGWSKASMSQVDNSYLIAYAIGQFLFGPLGDRFGARKVVLTGMLASIVVAALCGMGQVQSTLIGLMFVQGLCQATGWGPLAKNMGQFFSQRERGKVMGLWMTNYALGGFVATTLAGAAASRWGWEATFWVPAAALGVIWLIALVWQVNKPEDVGLTSIESYHGEAEAVISADDAEEPVPASSWEVIREVFCSPMVWLLSAVYFLTKPARYVILFWSPLYLKERLGTGVDASSFLAGMFDLAGPLGVIAGGYLTDRLFGSRRMPLCCVALLGAAGLLFVLDGLPANKMLFGAAMFAIGFLLFIPDSLVSGTAAIDFGTKQGASTAAGVINGFGSIAAILGGTLPGWVEYWFGKEANVWSFVFVSQSCCLGLAALLLLPCWSVLPPTVAERDALQKGAKRGT